MKGLKFSIFAEDKTKAAFQSVQASINSTKAKFSGLSKAMTSFKTLAVGAMAALGTKAILDLGDKFDKLSLKMGVSVETLSQLKFAGEQTGVGFETLTSAFSKMNIRIAEAANGGGAAAKSLQELGLNAAELKKLAPEDQFFVIADAMQGVESQSDKARIAMTLFEEGGVALIQTMDGGSESMRGLMNEADALGATFTILDTQKMAGLNDSFNRVTTATLGLGKNLLSGLAPAIIKIVDLTAGLISKLNVFDNMTEKIALTGIKIGAKLGLIDDEIADFAADEVMDRINASVKSTNDSLEAQRQELQRLQDEYRALGSGGATRSTPRVSSPTSRVSSPLSLPSPVLRPSDVGIDKRDVRDSISDGFRLARPEVDSFGSDLGDAAKEGLKEAIRAATGGEFNIADVFMNAFRRAGENQLDRFINEASEGLGGWFDAKLSTGAASAAGKITQKYPTLSRPEGVYGEQPNNAGLSFTGAGAAPFLPGNGSPGGGVSNDMGIDTYKYANMFAALQQLWATQQSRQGGEESGDGKKTYVFNNKIDVHVNGATDAGSFQAAQDQIIGTMMRKIRTVTQRNF